MEFIDSLKTLSTRGTQKLMEMNEMAHKLAKVGAETSRKEPEPYFGDLKITVGTGMDDDSLGSHSEWGWTTIPTMFRTKRIPKTSEGPNERVLAE